MSKKPNPAAELARLRWKNIPPAERAQFMPKGRKRLYPVCPRYRAHRFVNDRCPCGYVRKRIEVAR